ncbi:hypothetical protein ACE6H2_010649 [Prunus campanulata]
MCYPLLSIYILKGYFKLFCSRCRKSEETILHALWSCKKGGKFWTLTPFFCQLEAYHGSFADFFETVIHG